MGDQIFPLNCYSTDQIGFEFLMVSGVSREKLLQYFRYGENNVWIINTTLYKAVCWSSKVKALRWSLYVLTFSSRHYCETKHEVWSGFQAPLQTQTELCDPQSWVLFNQLRLHRFCSGTWLWSPVPVAPDQSQNRNSFPLTDIFYDVWLFSSLRSVSVPWSRIKRASSSLWYHWSIQGFEWGGLKPHFDGIRPCLVMNVVLGEETWMKGNENWQVEGGLRQWTDGFGRRSHPGVLFALASTLRKEQEKRSQAVHELMLWTCEMYQVMKLSYHWLF